MSIQEFERIFVKGFKCKEITYNAKTNSVVSRVESDGATTCYVSNNTLFIMPLSRERFDVCFNLKLIKYIGSELTTGGRRIELLFNDGTILIMYI